MERMLEFVASVMDAGGQVPMVGDADDAHIVKFEPGHAGDPYRELLATGAVWFRRGDFAAKAGGLTDKTRWLLGDTAVADFPALAAAHEASPPTRAFPDTGYYLLGSGFDTADEVRVLADAGPLGYRNGYWAPEEEPAVVEQIKAARADLLFVAISSPKKEQFLGRYQAELKIPFAMGVGGTFDVATGKIRRAPDWMQKSGLEWFYRFLQEPRRMFRRYFIDDMAFFWLLLKEVARY